VFDDLVYDIVIFNKGDNSPVCVRSPTGRHGSPAFWTDERFGVGPIELIEFSGVKLNNGLKISLKTMVLVAKMRV